MAVFTLSICGRAIFVYAAMAGALAWGYKYQVVSKVGCSNSVNGSSILCQTLSLLHSLVSWPPHLTGSDLKPPPSDLIFSLLVLTSGLLHHTAGTQHLFRLTTFVPSLQHVVLERGSSAPGRHLLLLTSECILLRVDVLNVRNREDSTQLRPLVTSNRPAKTPFTESFRRRILSYDTFLCSSLRHAENESFGTDCGVTHWELRQVFRNLWKNCSSMSSS
jgi:hypothetical protein